MKTINEIKDSVAQKHGYDDWDDLAKSFCYEPDTYVFFHNCENEASIAYASMAIEEQRQKCAEEYAKPYDGMERERVLTILNTPLVELK